VKSLKSTLCGDGIDLSPMKRIQKFSPLKCFKENAKLKVGKIPKYNLFLEQQKISNE
jgi:hypothetical protein